MGFRLNSGAAALVRMCGGVVALGLKNKDHQQAAVGIATGLGDALEDGVDIEIGDKRPRRRPRPKPIGGSNG